MNVPQLKKVGENIHLDEDGVLWREFPPPQVIDGDDNVAPRAWFASLRTAPVYMPTPWRFLSVKRKIIFFEVSESPIGYLDADSTRALVAKLKEKMPDVQIYSTKSDDNRIFPTSPHPQYLISFKTDGHEEIKENAGLLAVKFAQRWFYDDVIKQVVQQETSVYRDLYANLGIVK